MKNGIAVRLNLLIPTKVLCAPVRTDTSIGTIWRIAARDEIPIAYEIGTPMTNSAIKTVRIITKDCIATDYASFPFFSPLSS